MFCLVNEGIGYKDMVGSTSAFSECALEGKGDIGICHKVHQVGIKDFSEEFAEATCDGHGAVICWVMFGAFFMEGSNIGILPWGGELGGLI